jgi:mycobactin salicyl-AMP ligase
MVDQFPRGLAQERAPDVSSDERIGAPLCSLFEADRARNPAAVFLYDQPGGETWSGRASRVWHRGEVGEAVERLATCFVGLKFAPGALIGICLASGPERVLTLLAAELAGLTPFLLPLIGDWAGTARAIERAGLQAIVTQSRAGRERPAERLSEIAAGYFRLRFLMAFGPDVPDGVADLDDVLAMAARQPAIGAHGVRQMREPGLVTLPRAEAERRPVFRPARSLIAAAARILLPARIRPGDRLISLIAPDDLKGLALGPAAALLAGAALELHGMFDAASLSDSLDRAGRCHLVAPGWMEEPLSRLDLPDSLESLILVHQVPVRFRAHTALRRRVVDVLAFDETALIANARTPGGLFALSLDPGLSGTALADLLAIRLDDEAALSFRGPAAVTGELDGGALPRLADLPEWHSSCFKADLFAGIIIGVS